MLRGVRTSARGVLVLGVVWGTGHATALIKALCGLCNRIHIDYSWSTVRLSNLTVKQ